MRPDTAQCLAARLVVKRAGAELAAALCDSDACNNYQGQESSQEAGHGDTTELFL
jgi:hypothetical protein